VFFDLAGNFLSMPDVSGRVKKEGALPCVRKRCRAQFDLNARVDWLAWEKSVGPMIYGAFHTQHALRHHMLKCRNL
jgi:hypothetical protein